VLLKIFVTDQCWSCEEAHRIAVRVRESFPGLDVQLIDLEQPDVDIPDEVFATPTYMLKGRVVSLGNPRFEELVLLIERAWSPKKGAQSAAM
jgi:hypothetical protein